MGVGVLKVLIPVLSKREDSEEFLKEATVKAKEVLLLLVIDTRSSPSSGFTASEIAQGQKIMDSVNERIGKMRKSCESLLEWGDTMTRIDHTAKLRRVDSIVLLRPGAFSHLCVPLVNKCHPLLVTGAITC